MSSPTVIPEIFALLIFARLIFAVIYYSRFQEAAKIGNLEIKQACAVNQSQSAKESSDEKTSLKWRVEKRWSLECVVAFVVTMATNVYGKQL